MLGLVSVPLLGSASDHWRGRYGRRRPFIWALSLGVLLSLFLIPRAGRLAGLLCPDTRPLELALLILGVGLLDFCGQVCFTPLEALLSDLFRDPDHCRQAFSVYAFMISLGGCLGYLLPAVDWDASALAPYLGTQEECLFGLLALIFLTCVAATLFVAEEAALGPAEPVEGLSVPSVPPHCCPCHARLAFWNLRALFPRLHQLCCRMPRTLRRLFVAELCSWMAFMTFTLFYTDFVGEGLYQGVPRAEPGTEARRHYDEGKALAARGPVVGAALQWMFGRREMPTACAWAGSCALGPDFPIRTVGPCAGCVGSCSRSSVALLQSQQSLGRIGEFGQALPQLDGGRGRACLRSRSWASGSPGPNFSVPSAPLLTFQIALPAPSSSGVWNSILEPTAEMSLCSLYLS